MDCTLRRKEYSIGVESRPALLRFCGYGGDFARLVSLPGTVQRRRQGGGVPSDAARVMAGRFSNAFWRRFAMLFDDACRLVYAMVGETYH